MKSLVIYDSLYGNTEKIALVIGEALHIQGDVSVRRVTDVDRSQLTELDLLVVGSPTQRFKPTTETQRFLDSIPKGGLKGMKVAAFDTRLTWEEIEKSPPLPFFVKIYGYAAGRIAKRLAQKGGDLVAGAQGFFVEGMKGPLSVGEVERAEAWAKKFCA